jgi:PleD family two-component response regulator
MRWIFVDILFLRLKKKSDTDYLTGIWNRRGIIHLAEAVIHDELSIIIAEADKALYMAKNSGRNKVIRFHPEPGKGIQECQDTLSANMAQI